MQDQPEGGVIVNVSSVGAVRPSAAIAFWLASTASCQRPTRRSSACSSGAGIWLGRHPRLAASAAQNDDVTALVIKYAG